MKRILLTVITLFVVISGYAQYQLPTGEGFFNLNQSESSKWEGRWYRFGEEGDVSYMNFDASAYDYVWIKFSGNTSRFRLGIFYNEWKSTQAWGEQPWDDYVYISEREGYAFIKLEKTKTYEFIGPNKEASPYAGDTWDKHIREVFTQDDGVPVQVTVEGIWFGTQAQFDALPLVYESDGFNLTKTGATTCVVSGFSKSARPQYVTISSKYNGWTVTGICEGALKGVGDYNSLRDVVISDGITSIGERAFAMQTNLTSVTLPEGLTVIETGVFEGCSSLSQFNIPSTVEVIKPIAFNALSPNFRYLRIPESVQTICSQAFCVDPSTASQVTVICDSPTPPAVDVKTKDSTSDQWYEGSSFIGVGGSKIGKLIVPLGSKAAYEASDWKNSFSEIVEESIVNNVLIGDFYFNLNTMGKAEVTSNPNKYSGEIVIPESITYDGMSYKVTSIAEDAFSDCNSLTSVYIPSSVTSIGDNAFSGCNNLAYVIVKSLVPIAISDNVFPNRESITLYVHASSVDAYSTTTPWSGFNEIVAVTQEYTDAQGVKYNLNNDGRTYMVSGHTDACTGAIKIPETVNGCSVTSIGGSVFSGCSGLTSITIPRSVTQIGLYRWGLYDGILYPDEIFWHPAMGCDDLVTIIVEEGNPIYDSRDNCNAIIETATNTLIAGCKNSTIPSSVTTIGLYAFGDCSGLTSLIIPNGVTTIREYAFSGCSGLTSITISSSVSEIYTSSLSGCDNLTNITVDTGNNIFDSRDNCNAIIETATNKLKIGCKGTTIPNSITAIGAFSFDGCSGLTSVSIPNSVTFIDGEAFRRCTGLTSITIPSSVETIGEQVFRACTGLKSIIIPNSITAIGAFLLGECSALTDVYCYTENVPTTDAMAFLNSRIGYATLHVPAGSIEAYKAVAPWSEFKEIVAVPDQEYTDAQGVKYTLNDDGQTYAVSGHTDACTGTITIPATMNGCAVTTIRPGAFSGCYTLISVTIPKSVTTISGNPFSRTHTPTGGLTTIIVEEGNPVYDSRDNCNAIIETATNKLIAGCNPNDIPNSVTSIGDFAFQQRFDAYLVTIPNGVKTIGDNAFLYCDELVSVTIPNSVTSIGARAFADCRSLKHVFCYAENVPITGSDLFATETNIANAILHVPEGSIEAYRTTAPWDGFKSIEAIDGVTPPVIPGEEYIDAQGVKYTWDYYPWRDPRYTVSGYTDACKGAITILETVNGWEVACISSNAFNSCSGLTSITVPTSTIYIPINSGSDYPYSPFYDCNDLASIVVKEGNPVYDSRDNCNAIIETATNKLIAGCKNTIIPNSVTSIGDFAFIGCEGLTSITIPKSVTSFGFALHTCTGLTSIIVEEGNPKYDSRDNCNAIIETATNTLIAGCKNTTIPNNVTTIYYNAFVGCSGLTSITIPSSVTLINSWSFGALSGLTDVYCYAEKVPTVEADAFAMSNIENATLHVPEGSIEAYKAAAPWSEFKNIVAINTEVSISISASGKNSYTTAEALDFSEVDGLKAYVATGYEGSGTIWLTRIKQVPAGTPILIKGTPEKSYEVPVMDKCVAHFENMFQGSADEDLSINVTSADGKWNNYYMASGSFKKVTGPRTIGAGKCYLQLPASFKAAKAGDAQKVTISKNGKSSYAPPVDVDLTDVEGLKAYAATGYDAATSTIWLTRIFKIQAGEGVLLKGEAEKEYTLPSAEVQAYYGNMFVGNTGDKISINETSDDGVWTNFYLASGQFKKVSGSREIGTNKSYLQLPTSMLVSSARGKKNAGIDEWFMEELETETMFLGSIGGDDEDGTTRIDAIRNNNTQPETYYNLQGQRVNSPKKGIYIKNGKKVVIK